MNLSGTLNAFRVLVKPSLCLPQATISTFDKLPIPLNGDGWPEIKAVVLDKDNCFAVNQEAYVYKPYRDHFQALRKAYPGKRLLIVSNTAGTKGGSSDVEAEFVERNTGVEVFRHSIKKPGCGREIFEHFRRNAETGVTKPSEIAIVGDRLMTDVLMANMMGAWGVWVKDGVVPHKGMFLRAEKALPRILHQYGFHAPRPES